MKKIMIAGLILPAFLMAQSFNGTQMQLLQLESCANQAVEYGKLKGKSEKEIRAGLGKPNTLISIAISSCAKQLKDYGFVMKMPYEEQIKTLKKKKSRYMKRKKQLENRLNKEKKDSSLLGVF